MRRRPLRRSASYTGQAAGEGFSTSARTNKPSEPASHPLSAVKLGCWVFLVEDPPLEGWSRRSAGGGLAVRRCLSPFVVAVAVKLGCWVFLVGCWMFAVYSLTSYHSKIWLHGYIYIYTKGLNGFDVLKKWFLSCQIHPPVIGYVLD